MHGPACYAAMRTFASRSVAALALVLCACGEKEGIGDPPAAGDTDLTRRRMDLVTMEGMDVTPIKLATDPPGTVADYPGLEVKVREEGSGEPIRYGMIGRFHIIGTFASGATFQNTYEREPAVMRLLPPAIPLGLAVALDGMKTGGLRTVRVPPELGYGETGEPMQGIPAGALLLYEVEFIEVVRGLEVGRIGKNEGVGDPLVYGETASFKYTGVLARDGRIFDSTDTPRQFAIRHPGGVIAGWAFGLPGMKVGEKRRLYVPSSLAYGETGTQGIPPNADLVFEVELASILR